MSKGIWYAIGAYALWGLLPVYWKWLHHVPAPELLAHRIVWSSLALVAVIVATRRWGEFRAAIASRRVLALYTVAALLLGANWLTYVWAVNAGFIVETSLGYFINPLLSVLLGVIFLRERLRAGGGRRSLRWPRRAVLCLTFVPALRGSPATLAFSFGSGTVKDRAARFALRHGGARDRHLLCRARVFSRLPKPSARRIPARRPAVRPAAGRRRHRHCIPLLLFASAAQRISLTVVGILQSRRRCKVSAGVLVYRGNAFNWRRRRNTPGDGVGWRWCCSRRSYLGSRARAVKLEAE
jgi:chloramphenicol-sensitive protein RarD